MSIRRRFQIIYPDRSRKNVDATTKEQMLLSGELRPTSHPSKFLFAAPLLKFHSLAEMGSLLSKMQDNSIKRRYLGLCVTFELRDRRRIENEETPEGMSARLALRPSWGGL